MRKKETELVAAWVLLGMVAALEVVGTVAVLRTTSLSAARSLPLARGLATVAVAESLAALVLAWAAEKRHEPHCRARPALALAALGVVLALVVMVLSVWVGTRVN
jgi:hypothetical protein